MTSPAGDERRDAELGRALRALPAAGAPAEFVARVLARAEAAAKLRGQRRRRALSLVAGAFVVAAGLGLWGVEAAAQRAARRAALVDEHRRLQGELEELRELAARRSQLPLGGDASTDLYLDLSRIPAGPGAGQAPSTTRSPG